MTDNFEFRSINPDEVEQAIAIEQICFPPNEACSPKAMTERIAKVPQLFLVDRAEPECSCTATVSVKRQTDEKRCF